MRDLLAAGRRALWPLERHLRLVRLRWLMRELPLHDLRQAELILERTALEAPIAGVHSLVPASPQERRFCASCPRPRLGEVA